MKVRELIEILQRYDDDDLVVVHFKWKGESVLDDVATYSTNGPAIQLNTMTVFE
jgi:hypothetical protein